MKDNGLLAALERNASEFPDKTAFAEAGGEGLSWKELYARVCGLASVIASEAAKADPNNTDRPVAVFVGRDVKSVVALLAAAVSGRWYAAVDSELPLERTEAMLALCDPALIVSPDAKGLQDAFGNRFCVTGTDAACGETDALPLQREGSAAMFGIFTSGSTGMPKLVVKSGDAMMSFVSVYISEFGFTDAEVFGNQIPFYFDASTKDLFATVMLGATCIIIPQKTFSFPVNLVSVLNDYRISSIVWVPSALSIAARFDVFSAAIPLHLKNVLFVGEKMPVKYLDVWRKALPEARFVNLYGSTEVAGNSCYYVVDGEFSDTDILPIGKPFPGTKVFILDPETFEPAEEGEICISGPGLADGYYRDPDKTAEVFKVAEIDGALQRVCHSGDTGRMLPDGNLVCVARRDSQIKHMGHRIELGDIESAALSADYVREACAVYDPDNEKIVLVFSASDDESRQLRRHIASLLPKYMLPHKFICLPELPHNRNGKLDRAGIKRMVLEKDQ